MSDDNVKFTPYAEEHENGRIRIGIEFNEEIESVEGKALSEGVTEYIRSQIIYLACKYADAVLQYGLRVWDEKEEPPDLVRVTNGKAR